MDSLHTLYWFEFAEDDLDAAKILAEHGLRKINAVCFHAQQSAEKNLKGYLVANGVDKPPKHHDLRDLCLLCVNYDNTFEAILSLCNNLNPYGVRAKYPDELVIDENDARAAIADAQAITDFEPIAAVRTALEAECREQHIVAQATAVAVIKPPAENRQESQEQDFLEHLHDFKKKSDTDKASIAPSKDKDRNNGIE
jgi:HEPN domain-containing protein